MNDSVAKKLSFIGWVALFSALAGIVVLLGKGGELEKLDLGTLILAAASMGIALLVLSEIGPFISSFKLGDFEATLVESTGNKFLALEERVAKLELLASRVGVQPGASAELGAPSAPGLNLPQTRDDDQWKSRFGGQAEQSDFRLRAEFKMLSARFVEVALLVEYFGTMAIAPNEGVEFYIHQEFNPNIVTAKFSAIEGGTTKAVASISVIAYGGFTVGAWIPSRKVELELDLSEIRNAPRIVKEI